MLTYVLMFVAALFAAYFLWAVIGACVVVMLDELAPMPTPDHRVETLVLWTWPIWLVFLAALIVRHSLPHAWKRRC